MTDSVFNFINLILFALGIMLMALGRYLDAFVAVGVVLATTLVSLYQELRRHRHRPLRGGEGGRGQLRRQHHDSRPGTAPCADATAAGSLPTPGRGPMTKLWSASGTRVAFPASGRMLAL